MQYCSTKQQERKIEIAFIESYFSKRDFGRVALFVEGTPICAECSGGKLVITKADEVEAAFSDWCGAGDVCGRTC